MHYACSQQDYFTNFVVRQPCLWTGSIQPVRLLQTSEEFDNTDHKDNWDVNASLRLPISMCGPYAADFDGDEMTFYPVVTSNAEMECEAFKWNHKTWTPYNDSLYASMVHPRQKPVESKSNTLAICTTVCWTDRKSGLRATQAHEKWLTSKRAMIGMTHKHQSISDFIAAAQIYHKVFEIKY